MDCSWQIASPNGRLINLRYADDLVLFAGSLGQAQRMLEVLEEELGMAGLSLNGRKTKILTTAKEYSCSETPFLVEAGGNMVEVLRRDAVHKYLGKARPGDLRTRGAKNLEHGVS